MDDYGKSVLLRKRESDKEWLPVARAYFLYNASSEQKLMLAAGEIVALRSLCGTLYRLEKRR